VNIERRPAARDVAAHAPQAAALLRALAHPGRLLLLCHLLNEGEVTAGALAQRIGLAQSATSQHLQRLRADGLVATRRAGTVIHYRVADARAARILATLQAIFCPTTN
jgi:DNA-binding transcriptional ArsR family regulator